MNKVFKTIISLIFMVVLLFSFASCNDDSNPDDPVEENPPVVETKTYKVEFIGMTGEVLETKTVKEGEGVTEYPNIEMEGYYYFWDKTLDELKSITKDTKVNGTKLEYYVDAKYYIDGELFFETSVTYYKKYDIPALPEEYENCSWTEISRVLNGETYTIEYNLAYTLKSTYNVTFKDGSNTVDLGFSTYNVGEVIELPVLEKEGYFFVGWFLSGISLHKCEAIEANMRGDLTFFARFVEIEKQKLIELPKATYHFESIAKKPHGSGNGTFVYQPVLPTGLNSSVSNYKWSSSNESVATISAYSSITAQKGGYCVITATSTIDSSVTINCVIKVGVDGIRVATLEEANNIVKFTVKFVDKDDQVLSTQIVPEGSFAIAPIPKVYDGLAFVGWDQEFYNVQKDLTIKATYQTGTNNYAGKTFSILADSISTYKGYIPSGYAPFYPYPTADVNDVNQTWWMKTLNQIGGRMFINNSYGGTCVAVGGQISSNHQTRIDKLVASNQYADVLLIFMGNNDCNERSGVTDKDFTKHYNEMLDKIAKTCKNSEVILCTMPVSNLYSEARRVEFNDIIRTIASERNLKVIEFANVDLRPHLIDSAHPGVSGMEALAKQAIKDLQK